MENGFEEFLRNLAGANKSTSPSILPEAAIARLREAGERYAVGNLFRIGDIVTPRKDSDVKGAGDPHVVIETKDSSKAEFAFVGAPGSNTFGQRLDLRVLHISNDRIVPHWVESWQFEWWTEQTAAADEIEIPVGAARN
ncbi:hypothetical protein [Methylosinus sp. PW1]|uniref:hypothetical protein n=1 Tax=Methylosinus sp. PW1 TaxID=107636 RepID=UPI00068CD744|nr:hypothetical protein [Methylosinus sp. PW1]